MNTTARRFYPQRRGVFPVRRFGTPPMRGLDPARSEKVPSRQESGDVRVGLLRTREQVPVITVASRPVEGTSDEVP